MRVLRDDVTLIASPNIPLGKIGISQQYKQEGVKEGELVPFYAKGMKRLRIAWVSLEEEARATALVGGHKWVCLNREAEVFFDHSIEDKPSTCPVAAPPPTIGTVDGTVRGHAVDYKTASPTGRKESQPNMQQMSMPADAALQVGKAVHKALEEKYTPKPGGEALKHEILESASLPPRLVNPDTGPEVPYTTVDGKTVVVCLSKEMDPDVFPDYVVRMADVTRVELNLSWDTPWRIGGRLFKVKPALQGDLDALRGTTYADKAVFLQANSVPPGVRAMSLPEVRTTSPEDGIARVYLEQIIGKELMRDVDVETIQMGNKVAARIYYKMWAAGVSEGKTIQDAIDDALRQGLRSDLVNARNKIDATISKLDTD